MKPGLHKRVFLLSSFVLLLAALCVLLWDAFTLGEANDHEGKPHMKERLHTAQGTVTDATMNTLTLRTGDGKTFTFLTEDAQRSGPSGTVIGDTFAVTYVEADGGNIARTYEKTAAKKREPHGNLPDALPDAWLDGGIFEKYYPQAYETLRSMTLEEKVGQLFLARFPGKQALSAVHVCQPGGFVLFGEDFKGKSKQEVQDMLSAVQDASSVPLLLATDEEGGTVVRVSSNPALADSSFLSPQELYAQGGIEALKDDAKQKSELLKDLGINVNLGPVCDVSTDPGDYIFKRSMGQPAEQTAACVAAIVQAAQKAGVSATLKHFPGYGNNVDTHTGIAHDARPLTQFETGDFLPFEEGIGAGAHSVLVSHNIVACIDKDYPASLSPAVHKLLRDKLRFTGVIMTDDLAMDAIQDFSGDNHPAVQALLSGNDLILVTDLEGGVRSITKAVKSGDISEEILSRAVFRVLSWKLAKGLMD